MHMLYAGWRGVAYVVFHQIGIYLAYLICITIEAEGGDSDEVDRNQAENKSE